MSTYLSEKTTLGNYVDFSDHYVNLSEQYVDLSFIKFTSRWQLGAFTRYKTQEINLLVVHNDFFLTIQHKNRTSRHDYLTSGGRIKANILECFPEREKNSVRTWLAMPLGITLALINMSLTHKLSSSLQFL